ncbi:DUF3786 domain-containing protein [Sporomusa acidovorans]|uniref:DUF3786 domain-containing protein n=1 Tax=Sporomusa acidovorans (strain ATCC 49682 / DSM 3132 / Mol) TaxID=1123286 RepID=A0ABZ3J0K4_SPOA4|nr:DUF3786 domain-containing protein [Sporomusa acidovorans]OZC14468.1 hypothetical protein SPACI_52690 [Sporomusa acidovorans DSM 3132]SDF49700.1 protein of unknown function [Sporomusa acidovorans]
MQTGNSNPQHLQDGYQLAYEKACAGLNKKKPADMAASSGADFDENKSLFTIKYINEVYNVHYPDGEVNFADRQDPVPVAAKVILLHYLLTASGSPLTGKWISFKEIPGGMIYIQPFNGRVLGAFKAVFGKKAELLTKAGEKIGGSNARFGDVAVTLNILPQLPVTYVIWEGDEEFPANATALFDATAQYYLPTEDLVVAAAAGASLLNKTARTLS